MIKLFDFKILKLFFSTFLKTNEKKHETDVLFESYMRLYDRDASVRIDQIVMVCTKTGYLYTGKNESTNTSPNLETSINKSCVVCE